MHRQVGCFSPGHPTQAAWLKRMQFQSAAFLQTPPGTPSGGASGNPTWPVLSGAGPHLGRGVCQTQVFGPLQWGWGLPEEPYRCPLTLPVHTHTHACKLRPLATGDWEHSVIAQLFQRGSGRGTSPETLCQVAPRLSQRARHWLWPCVVRRNAMNIFCSLSSMKSSPGRVCCRTWESPSKNPVGTLVPQGATALQPRGRPLGGLLHRNPAKSISRMAWAWGCMGPASRKTLTVQKRNIQTSQYPQQCDLHARFPFRPLSWARPLHLEKEEAPWASQGQWGAVILQPLGL